MNTRLGTLLLLALVAVNSPVRAGDEPEPAPAPPRRPDTGYRPYYGYATPNPPAPQKWPRPFRRPERFNYPKRVYLEPCKTHHEMGTTGWRGEAIFIFGSSVEFFEERCPLVPSQYPHYRSETCGVR